MYTASLHKIIDMLNKNTQGAKKARPSQKHQLAMHTTKKGDIWWRPRPKLLYILEGSVSHQLWTANAI